MRKLIRFIVAFAALAVSMPTEGVLAQSPLAGRWDGGISIMSSQLAIAVAITPDGTAYKGTIDIPQQNAVGLPLKTVTVDGAKVHMELAAGPGLAVFDGELKGDVISGKFEQAGIAGTFELKRSTTPAVAAPAALAPEPPPPYKVEEVKYPSGAVTLAGTLTIPPSNGPHPAVVLITGSGAQNRDEEIFGFKVFRVIADHLTRNGIAVLRVDDRGVGGSTGNTSQSTTADFADDVLAGVRMLQARPDIDGKRIGLMGHSEGGLVAPIVAARAPDVAFIVMMSGPGLTGEKILSSQAELIGRAAGRTDDDLKRNRAIQLKLFDAVRTGTGWDEAEAMIRTEIKTSLDAMTDAQRKAVGDAEKLAATQVAGQMAMVKAPWFKYFLDLDPAVALAKVRCPTLVLFGEHDLQVEAGPNRAAVEDVFRKSGFTKYRIDVFPRANHLYQDSPTGSVAEYASLKKEFVPGFLGTVTSWITEQVGRK